MGCGAPSKHVEPAVSAAETKAAGGGASAVAASSSSPARAGTSLIRAAGAGSATPTRRGNGSRDATTKTTSSSVIRDRGQSGSGKPHRGRHKNRGGSKIKQGGNSDGGGDLPSTRPRTDTWEFPFDEAAGGEAPANSGGNSGSSGKQQPSQSSSSLHKQQPHHSSPSSKQQQPPQQSSSLSNDPDRGVTLTPQQLQQQHQERIVQQWKSLWETQSPALADPADAVSILERNLERCCNLLSPVQVLQLQRRIRRQLSQSGSGGGAGGATTTTGKIVAKVFSSSGGGSQHGSHHHHHHPHSNSGGSLHGGGNSFLDPEARALARDHRVLAPALLRSVLPPCSTVTDSIVLLMTAFSEQLWERVRLAAADAAVAVGVELDANRQIQKWQQQQDSNNSNNSNSNNDDNDSGAISSTINKMPKPSQIPVLSEPVADWPAGASLLAVAAVLGLACGAGSTRRQKLQLLFYALMEAEDLQDFLMTHPAGGVPVWLLEVGSGTVVSLPSLTHYHYYGNAFVPCGGGDPARRKKAGAASAFCASKSRLPVTIDPQRTLQIIAEALLHAAGVSGHDDDDEEEDGGGDGAKAVTMIELRYSEPVSKLLKDSVTIIGGTGGGSSGNRDSAARDPTALFRKATDSSGNNHNSGGHNHDSDHPADGSDGASPVTRLLNQVASGRRGQPQDLYVSQHHKTELDQSVHWFEAAVAKFFAQTVQNQQSGSGKMWTLEDFDRWTATALDDLALDVVLHRLFGEGVVTSPALERDLVWQAWSDWQQSHGNWLLLDAAAAGRHPSQSVTDMISSSVVALMGTWNTNNPNPQQPLSPSNGSQLQLGAVWGGLGNVDGGGGTGYGVLYCVPSQWWSAWCSYTGWTFVGDLPKPVQRLKKRGRPGTLNTESLLWNNDDDAGGTERSGGKVLRGAYGFYEVMRPGVRRGKDYVLVPPGVWNVLYELYGGGPPLPRMVQSPNATAAPAMSSSSSSKGKSHHHQHHHPAGGAMDPPDASDEDHLEPRRSGIHGSKNEGADVDEVMGDLMMQQRSHSSPSDGHSNSALRVRRIPDRVAVVTHPWMLHVQLCDPLQPYRRGDYSGPLSIRVMVCPEQPLWRVLGEIVVRFPTLTTSGYRTLDATSENGCGRVRLWKRMDVAATTATGAAAVPRYGPWNLLCHGRHALLPPLHSENNSNISGGSSSVTIGYDEIVSNWKAYADEATVESIGLNDNDSLMLEFAVLNKNNELTWPREAAAKAGKVRRLAEEDRKFRNTLEGLDDQGSRLTDPPDLVGMEVDAMDSGGRWYTVKILAVEIVDEDTSEEEDEDDDGVGENSGEQKKEGIARKKVKVNFKEHGGHYEWIDIASDRLQTAGRFASEAEQQQATTSSSSTPTANGSNHGAAGGTGGESRSRSTASAKRSSSNAESNNAAESNTKACALPGFGACGLTNLGNTCYMNSAVQCLAYIPLLRAYLLSAQYKTMGDLNKDNAPFGTNGQLLLEFAELFKHMWSTRLAEKSPNRFKTQLGKFNAQFVGVDQQDAQEFLTYIIDMLHEDSNKIRKKPYVENPEDSWVEKTSLPRVGDEAWRRFLRRNRSIMADVLMGQELNTVTCPSCNYSSRKFDPFNLLSIPIPTLGDVIFQCTVIRRATAANCPSVLNRARKGDKKAERFPNRKLTDNRSSPPSDAFVAEQYVIALSRLADSGDIRLQLQNLCGIRANRMRLCRMEETVIEHPNENVATKRHIKCYPLSEKDGPASQYGKKKGMSDENSKSPTQILAFEFSLNTRRPDDRNGKGPALDDTADEDEEAEAGEFEDYPSPAEKAQIDRYLEIYGDEKECRLLDTDPLVLAKAVSRSLWPRTDSELKVGLRVDAKDHRGNWYPGSIVDIFEDEIKASDADTGQEVSLRQKKVRIHFDNFLPKWDEVYSIEHFRKGKVNPLYTHSEPKGKSTEFLVHHRFTTRGTGSAYSPLFGQSFYVQCQNEWSNARAGAHVLAQASRFLQQHPGKQDPNRVCDKAHAAISELIDLLVDCDREFLRLALGVSKHNSEKEGGRPYRNPGFDAVAFDKATNTKVQALLHRLPFEVRMCTLENSTSEKAMSNEEVGFPFSLTRTIGNSVSIRNAVVLHWREPPVDKKNGTQKTSASGILYTQPPVQRHEASAEILKNIEKKTNGQNLPGSGGIDLGLCLTEFCKVQNLLWKCPRCKENRESGQNTNLWRLPDVLTFHIKRFNMSARWHEKITTKVDFPLTGLDMSKWCHKESPVFREDPQDSYIYDLTGVVNHYGSSMTGGHYTAICKASLCGRDGREEVAYNFSGVGAGAVESGGPDEPTGWGLGRGKTKVNQSKVEAEVLSRAAADSAEPMWLQFDDEVVESISPKQVVSEMAYVLFYRRRRVTPSNIVKYSTLE